MLLLKPFFPVDRETVRLALKVMDPDGVAGRKKHRLKRRKYFSPSTSTSYLLVNGPNSIPAVKDRQIYEGIYFLFQGPNFLWHINGYDKLKAYGFAIHGWIDG